MRGPQSSNVISKYWLSTVVSAEESSTQVEVAFTRALVADGKEHLLDAELLQELATGVVPDNDERIPVLLAISDQRPADDLEGHCFVHGRGADRSALRPPRYTERPGVGGVLLRAPQS